MSSFWLARRHWESNSEGIVLVRGSRLASSMTPGVDKKRGNDVKTDRSHLRTAAARNRKTRPDIRPSSVPCQSVPCQRVPCQRPTGGFLCARKRYTNTGRIGERSVGKWVSGGGVVDDMVVGHVCVATAGVSRVRVPLPALLAFQSEFAAVSRFMQALDRVGIEPGE